MVAGQNPQNDVTVTDQTKDRGAEETVGESDTEDKLSQSDQSVRLRKLPDHSIVQSEVSKFVDLTEKSLNQSEGTKQIDHENKLLNQSEFSDVLTERTGNEPYEKLLKENDEQKTQSEVLHVPTKVTDIQITPLQNTERKSSSHTASVDDTTDACVKTKDDTEVLKDQTNNYKSEVNGTTGSLLHNIPKTSLDLKSEPDNNKARPESLEIDNNSANELSDCGTCVLEDKENLTHSTESSKWIYCDSVENNWPFVIDDNVLVNFLELENKYFENGDFSFFVKESDTGQVRLYLKYFVNGNSAEVIIPEGEFGKLFTMEWKEDFLSESSEDLGASLQNCLVSLEDSVDKLRWENVVASMGPFHHGNVRLKHSLMSRPGNSAGVSNANHESALPKHVFSSEAGYNGNAPGSDCDKRPANCRNAGEDHSVGRQRWQNASYRSAISPNSQGKHVVKRGDFFFLHCLSLSVMLIKH